MEENFLNLIPLTIILSDEKPDASPLRFRARQEYLLLLFPFHFILEVLIGSVSPEKEVKCIDIKSKK